MKILYLFATAETSVAIVTLNQIKALKKYYPSLDIRIACVNYYPERSILDGLIDYKKDFNPNQIINYYQSIKFVRQVKKDFLPDVTISNLGAVNAFNVLGGISDIKVGIFHSPMIQFKNKNVLTKLLNLLSINFIYNKLNALIGISSEVVLDLNKYIKNTNIKLFYNIHDVGRVIELSLKPNTLDLKEKNSIEILCLGTIDYNKRQDLLLKAIKANPNKSIKVYIVGKVVEEKYYQKLINFVKVNNIQNQINFIPFLSNPYPLIKRVDAVISMSESEGLPGVLIESLLLNTPVIATNSSLGVWEILDIKDRYYKLTAEEIIAKKGIIIPNPKDATEDYLTHLLNNSLEKLFNDKVLFQQNEFKFLEEISSASIHRFYNFLQLQLNENNN